MAKKINTMTDSSGNEIPLKYVGSYDKARDKVTRRILARFVKARSQLEEVVAESIKDLDGLAKLKDSLGKKGNFSARSFDGLIQISIRQQYNIRLDERVIRARELMLEYVGGVLDRVDGVDVSALRLLVMEAFKANSQGFLSTGRVLSLMRMEVNSDKWREAKMILQDALKPEKGKQYLQVETRKTTQADFRAIRLDIADCWPSTEKEDL
ncbi:MAG: DUF3164 family protein [Kiritimatiellae bacterium]|nr:DUF3164 family protein [Kiritimatiellia bacterium]